jgi:hypothetical protein
MFWEFHETFPISTVAGSALINMLQNFIYKHIIVFEKCTKVLEKTKDVKLTQIRCQNLFIFDSL